MALQLVTVPCLSDNYAFLLHDELSGETVVVDVPEAAPLIGALQDLGWQPSAVWLTHHHDDHVQGLAELLAAYPDRDIAVLGAAKDAHRLPALSRALNEGDRFDFGGEQVEIFDVSGHTVGHIAFVMADAGYAFTGDSLMAMGCGRLFEGSPALMWQSLSKLMALPPETLICSGHEYTASNMRFARALEPENAALISREAEIIAAREAGEPTVPSTLALELETNPFLRAQDPDLAAAVGLLGASPEAVFTETRARKDRF